MKRLFKLSLILLALLLSATGNAHDFEVNGIYYNITNGNEVAVTYRGTSFSDYLHEYYDEVSIPATVTYKGTTYSVTSIDYSAFRDCSGLTSVTIPNSVTSIGSSAFECCTELTSIDIPNSVTELGWYTFLGCSGMTSVIIPNSITEIGVNVFTGCLGLTSVTIPNSVTSIGERAFSGCSGLTSVNIPNSVTSIDEGAFDYTTWYDDQPEGLVYAGLVVYKYKGTIPEGTSITIKEGTLGIASSAFSGCTGLTSIIIPNSVTSIGGSAFNGCTGLTSIIIPNSVTKIGHSVFCGCTGLIDIFVDSECPIYDSRDNCNAIIETTSNTLVAGCKNTFIPNSVTAINNGAFNGCTGLTSIIIPNSVTSIGSSTFQGCTGLTSIIIPNSVTSIGGFAFRNCSGLTSIDIPNSVTIIHESAFSGCSGLTSVTIPNSVTSIGYGVFSGCNGLTSVTIPNSVTSIGSSTFQGCTGLTSIIIPNSVTKISDNAFRNCTSLTNINIPNSVTSIGYGAFSSCTSLNDVYSYITDPTEITMGSSVFYQSPNNYEARTLHVPAGSLEAYQAGTKWSQYFGSIVEMEPENILATSVELDYESVELTEGETLQLTATVLPEDATDKSVTWTTSDQAIATVDENGLVTALATGTATITATTNDGSKLSATCVVNVTSPVTPPTNENQFVVTNISAKHGDVVVIPVALINSQTFAAFQTDIFLPEGFSIVTDEDSEYIVTPSERLTSDHVLMTSDANNGSVRVLCYTPNALPIDGSEGELFYITIQVPNDAEGTYIIALRNSLLTTTEYQEISIPDAEGQMEIYAFIPGDVNDSRTVTVTDIVVTAQYVLDRNPSPFIFEAADMNGDGNVTVTDIMLIAYLINHPTMNAPKRMPALASGNDRMSGEDVTLMAGETRTVSILLDNETDYTAFQMDLTLPEGLTASNFQLTDRAGNHAFDVSTLSSGKTRVLCYSPAIEVIEGHEGVLLTFDVTATDNVVGSIIVDDIEMVTANCQTVLMNNFTIGVNSTTSVNELSGVKAVARVDYFNLAGQQIDRLSSGVTLVVTTYTDGTRSTTKVIK